MMDKSQVEHFNRTCRWGACDESMEDLGWREFCDDDLDRVIELISLAESGYYGPLHTGGEGGD